MAWFFGVMGFTHQQPNFANSIRLQIKMIPFIHFMLFGVYADIMRFFGANSRDSVQMRNFHE